MASQEQELNKTIEECEKSLIALGLSREEILGIRDTIKVMIERYMDVYLA